MESVKKSVASTSLLIYCYGYARQFNSLFLLSEELLSGLFFLFFFFIFIICDIAESEYILYPFVD